MSVLSGRIEYLVYLLFELLLPLLEEKVLNYTLTFIKKTNLNIYDCKVYSTANSNINITTFLYFISFDFFETGFLYVTLAFLELTL